MRVDRYGFTLEPSDLAHRLKVLASHYGGANDVAWQAARVLSAKPEQWQKDAEWRTVYLSRYARIPPSDQEGKTSRVLWGWVRQTSRFLEQEAGKSRLVGEGEDG